MARDEEILVATWTGPYSWPQFEHENGMPSVPEHPGVYLWTVEYRDGYLIYAAGITRRAISTRLREHTRKYMRGDYTVLEIEPMRAGVRTETWHGWGWSPVKRDDFATRKEQILQAVHYQLGGFRVFVTNISPEPRVLERLEASIMSSLYRLPSPLGDMPDKGMHLSGRRTSEAPILIKNSCHSTLYGLPPELEI